MASVTDSTSTSINSLMSTMNASTAKTKTDDVSADTDKFMTLLVTQLQNQDPLNPMDNAQMTSQLAQLQTVTGINNLNTTLTSLQSSYQNAEALTATNLIGKGVLVEGSDVTLASSKGVMGVELGTAADSVKVTISDANGKEVDTIDLGAQPAGTTPLAWDGKSSSSGATLPDGNYTFKVTATSGAKTLDDAKGLSLDSVASVTTSNTDGVKLYLAGKGTTTLADIKQVL
jgi:flagellar basal-body rod modification protein FlgD